MTGLRTPSLLAICLMSVSLAACGGGGGGGGGGSSSGTGSGSSSDTGSPSGDDDTQSFSELPERGGFDSSGQLVTSGQFANNITDLDNPPTQTGGSGVRIAFDDGSPAIIGVRAVDEDSEEIRTFILDQDDIVNRDGRIVAFVEDDQSAIVIDPDDADFDYQRFGIWAEESDEVAAAAAFNSGIASPEDAQPRGTYEGDSIGVQTIYQNPDSGVAYTATRSDVTITVQGSDGQFSTSDTRLVSKGGERLRSQPDLDLDGTLDVQNGNFDRDTVTGVSVQGEVEGTFFGPDAEEVGGTFETNNDAGTYIGSFGAERDD